MMLRGASLALLLLVPLVLAGCASPKETTLSRVAPKDGNIDVVAARGLNVSADQGNHTLAIGLAPVAQTQVLQACAGACRNLTVGGGTLIADTDVVAFSNLTLVATNATSQNAINFVGEDGAFHFLRWSDAQADLQVNADMLVGGNLTATRYLGTRTPLVFNAGTAQERVVTISTAALEGAEVAVFARGSAQLANGTARIDLPQAFQALLGEGALTVQLTLTSDGPPLYVAQKAPDHLLVRATEGKASDATFDWFVQAPRKGASAFEV